MTYPLIAGAINSRNCYGASLLAAGAAKLTLSVRLWHTVLVRRVVVDNEQIINDY